MLLAFKMKLLVLAWSTSSIVMFNVCKLIFELIWFDNYDLDINFVFDDYAIFISKMILIRLYT